MLNVHIRSEIKEIVILLVFSGLMVETLSSPTIVVVVIGAIMVWFRRRPDHTKHPYTWPIWRLLDDVWKSN